MEKESRMTALKLGDKIRYKSENSEYNGIEGIITDIYSKWLDVSVTKTVAGSGYAVEDEAYGFAIAQCTLIETGDGAGNLIEFDKVNVGDTIRATKTVLGVKFTAEGVVGQKAYENYNVVHLLTDEGGHLAGGHVEGSNALEEIYLIKKAEPLKDSKVGTTFEHKVGANTIRYRKAHKDYWIAETTDEWGTLISHFTINNDDIHQTYEMVEEQQKIKREAVPLPPTGRYLL